MKIVFTRHALGKFEHKSVVKLKIKKKHVEGALIKGEGVWEDQVLGVKLVLGKIDEKHNIRVVFRQEGDIITVITFHPAERGRYEEQKG